MSAERLPATHPELAAEWSEKNEYPPENYSYGCRDKVWWKCPVCGGEWQAKINNRSHGSGCPYCNRGSTVVQKGFNDLASRFPEIAAEWSERNLPLTPDQVRYGSNLVVWWKCAKGHEWEKSVHLRTKGNNCPVCANRVVIKGDNDFATHYPGLAKELSEKNPIRADEVIYGYHKKVWWKCSKCGNEFEHYTISRIRWPKCPFCEGREVKQGFNDLASQYPEIAAEWDYRKNGKSTPETVYAEGSRLAWWKCPAGHSWRSRIRERTKDGKVCTECRAVFDAKLPLLLLATALEETGEKTVPDHVMETGLRLELYVPGLMLAAEVEGVSAQRKKEQTEKKNKSEDLGIRYLSVKAGKGRMETALQTEKILEENGVSKSCTEEMITELWNEYLAAVNGLRKEGKHE